MVKVLLISNSLFKLSVFVVMFTVGAKALAQTESEQKQDEEAIESVVVTGRTGDKAMSAFNAGRFDVAEMEFKLNAKCARRIERNKQAAIQNLQRNQVSQNASSSANSGGSSPDTAGSTVSSISNSSGNFSNSRSGGSSGKSKKDPKPGEIRERTCDDRGFQLFMVGLSQLQLGRPDDAEKNFKKAVTLNKRLYDAHYRLALMDVLRDDTKGAKKHLSKINGILKRCRDCDAKDEILVRVNFLEKVFAGEVKLK